MPGNGHQARTMTIYFCACQTSCILSYESVQSLASARPGSVNCKVSFGLAFIVDPADDVWRKRYGWTKMGTESPLYMHLSPPVGEGSRSKWSSHHLQQASPELTCVRRTSHEQWRRLIPFTACSCHSVVPNRADQPSFRGTDRQSSCSTSLLTCQVQGQHG